MAVYCSTAADALPCTSRSSPRSTPPPCTSIKKRPAAILSDRINFAKARLNRVSQKKKHLFNAPADRFQEQADVDEDTQLLEAAKGGRDAKIKDLIAQGCKPNFVDETGRSALHWAAEYGYMRVVYMLVDAGWDINLPDDREHSPLHVACDHRHGNIATWLITVGCNVNQTDSNGNTALHRAVHANLDTIAVLLCNIGVDVNVRTNNDWTPLHEAARVGNEQVVRKLLKCGADVNAVSRCNATPFLTAVFFYRIAHKYMYTTLDPILKMFINSGCRLSQSDGQWTPLSSSIAVFNSRIAGLLIYNGCLIPREESIGRSLLVDAFDKCDTFVVKLLVMAGYQVTPEEVELCARRIPTFSLSFLRLAFPGSEGGKSGRCLEIIQYLRQKASNPFTLSELCRTSIRRGLNAAAGDTSILQRIPRLPLPAVLKPFISLEDYALRFLH